MGGDFGHFRGTSGVKIKNLLEKKNDQGFLQIKMNCINVALKSHIYIIQL